MLTFQGDSTANGGANNHLCANNIQLAANQEKTFFCKPTASGRYVYIRNSDVSRKVVVVCEVEVYSSYTSSKFSFSVYNNNVIGWPQMNNVLLCRGEGGPNLNKARNWELESCCTNCFGSSQLRELTESTCHT